MISMPSCCGKYSLRPAGAPVKRKTRSATRPFSRLGDLPASLRKERRPLPVRGRVGRGGVALLAARQHALQDDGDAEQREGEVEGRDRLVAPGAALIGRHIGRLIGDAERREIEARHAAERLGRVDVGQAVIGEVGERVAEGRQFPVEDADDAGLARVEDHVVEADVPVADGRLVARRDVPRQPIREPVDRRVVAGARGLPLLRPAPDLAREVVAGPSEPLEPDRPPIGHVEAGQRLDHAVIDAGARLARQLRQGRLPEDAAPQALHQVEGRADHAAVVAEQDRAGHRHVGLRERLDHPVLAVDGVGGGQELARRLLAQHVFAAIRDDQEGRVRLPAAHLAQLDEALAEPVADQLGERRGVEAMRLADRDGFGVGGSRRPVPRQGRSPASLRGGRRPSEARLGEPSPSKRPWVASLRSQ